ncbi:MAG TPA: EcsC family protein [Thermodesulfobacteriota bacterium]|nr:EcsC family protein [Thermodesulfobacteriota bacterium]
MNIPNTDLADLERAYRLLENPGIVPKLTSLLGTPIEKSLGFLPERWSNAVRSATKTAIERAMDFAVESIDNKSQDASSDRKHKVITAITGAAGGFFGTPALLIELPVTTVVMLRSIADIARNEGEDLSSIESRLACVEVFALGGESKEDEAAETGYYAVRSSLAKTFSEASRYIAQKGVTDQGAPVLVRFINSIASRFSVVVSEKVTAQLIPVIGAAGGAMINVIFTDHFQNMAHGHFTVRRLERKYGKDVVRREYEKLRNQV